MTRGMSGNRQGVLSVFVRDNLEAFAVAIALALVVRHYSLEAFRIPSKSMMPTLLGSEVGGDRILVDKGRWLRHEPDRWEPTVFQYPLNRTKNFIKRMVGMPGETMKIEDGDIWTSRDDAPFQIERKPEGPQEALFFPYYPEPVEDRGFFADRRNWEGLGWEIDERAGRFAVDASGNVALRFLADVVQYRSEGISGDARLPESKEGYEAAGDLRVRFDLDVERAGTLVIELTEHGLARRLVLAPEGSRATVALADGTEQSFPVGLRLAAGMELSVSFANVDDALLVRIGGDADVGEAFHFSSAGDVERRSADEERVETADQDAARLERDGDAEKAARVRTEAEALRRKLAAGRYRVTFDATGLKATLTRIRIDRDVHYTQEAEWEIPAGHYFMLGDNTNASKDSRRWEVAEVTLKDGTVIRWEEGHDLHPGDVPGQPDANFETDGPDRVIEVRADVDGLVRRFHTRDVARLRRGVPWGFVSKDHLVGRAFAIFWPIHVWPILKNPTRIGLIR